MPRWDDLISTNYDAAYMADELSVAYRWAFDRLIDGSKDYAGLKTRMRLLQSGLPSGGGATESANRALRLEIKNAIDALKADLTTVSPDLAAYMEERSRELTKEFAAKSIRGVAATAPEFAKVAAKEAAKKYGEYLNRGSLLRQKSILQKFQGSTTGALKSRYTYIDRVLDQRLGRIVERKIVAAPIHWREIQRTEAELRKMLVSGENFGQIVDRLEKNVFGVDAYQFAGGKVPPHPALPNPVTGEIADPSYGLRRGFTKKTNPLGALADVKRLARTELSNAHHAARKAYASQLREDGLVIGVHVDPEHGTGYGAQCPICGPALDNSESGRDFLYSDGEPDYPPYHPNCECTETRVIWAPVDLSVGMPRAV